MGVTMGWCSDYPDPYDWINILLYGRAIQAENNVNYSYFNDPKWNKKMESAARLVGPNRLKVYGQLDLDIMTRRLRWPIERTYNNRYMFSNRVNPKSLVYQGIYQDFRLGCHGPEVGGSKRTIATHVRRRLDRRLTSFTPVTIPTPAAGPSELEETRVPISRQTKLWAILLFIVITFVTFVIFFVGPNNPARAVCGGEQAKRECLVGDREARPRPADAGPVREVRQAAGASTRTSASPSPPARASTSGSRRPPR